MVHKNELKGNRHAWHCRILELCRLGKGMAMEQRKGYWRGSGRWRLKMADHRYLRCNLHLHCNGPPKCSDIFGQPEKADKFSGLAQNLTKAVYQKCWDVSRGYLSDTPAKKAFSMHAQIFAVLTNTIPESDQKEFVKRFMNDKSLIQPTMYFRFYLTQALKKTGLADLYLETLGLWHEMLKKGFDNFRRKS